jgi:hypothetical protein
MFGVIVVLTTAFFNDSHFCGVYIRGLKWQSGIAIGDRVDLDFFLYVGRTDGSI